MTVDVVLVPAPEDGARVVADAVQAALPPRGRGPVSIGLATGSSPLPAYRELVRRHTAAGLSFAGVRVFLLDEYVGLPRGHPESYRAVIRRELTDAVGIPAELVHGPDGASPDPPAAALAYERQLAAAGPLAVQLLGIGVNGHVGFNEPGSPPADTTRLTTLTRQTRIDNARFFGGDVEAVPRRVLTQGLATILRAEHLVLVATGSHKAAAVAAAVEGPLTASVPASALQTHPHVTVVVDEAAGSALQRRDRYRELGHEPGAAYRYDDPGS